MKYNYKRCEDDEDAARMAGTILGELGYLHINLGSNEFSTMHEFSTETLLKVAQYAERIARWARSEAKSREARLGR